MKKKGRGYELGLLLLPALALGGVALWMQNSGYKQAARDRSGPFRLVVERVERQEATPRDVAEGFDTRVVVTLGYKGRRPEAWGEAWSSMGGGSVEWKCRPSGQPWRDWSGTRYSTRSLLFDSNLQSYKCTVSAQASKAPSRLGELKVQLVSFSAERQDQNREISIIPRSTIEIPIRREGETIPVPRNTSRYCPLKVKSTQIRYVTGKPGAFVVDTNFEPLEPLEADARISTVGQSYFEDENGKRYPDSSGSGSKGGADNYNWHLDASRLPKTRRLSFHARVSLNEHWPVNIRAVLWDKTKPATT